MSDNSYGKDKVRVTKVKRGAHLHEVMQFTIRVRLHGEFAAAYTIGDNRLVVATDTIKNTCYAIASDHACNEPETYAIDLCRHFLRQYSHVSVANIELTQDLYDRIPAAQGGHPTAWVHRGTEKRYVNATVSRASPQHPKVITGIVGLSVLRTAGSEWADFHRDEYRTLGDTKDRLLATTVDLKWEWNEPWAASYNATYDGIRSDLLTMFANHHSLGVQQTMYKVTEEIIKRYKYVEKVRMSCPNIHHIPFDLSRVGGRTNRNEIFITTSEPCGLINIEMGRTRSAKL